MVSGHSDDVSGLQRDVLRRASLVRVDGDLVVRVLSTEVVDVSPKSGRKPRRPDEESA